MDSIIISNEEETVRVWSSEEQLAEIVKLKTNAIICNVALDEGGTLYEANIEEVFLIH